jgi:hypothetical protein
VADFFETLRRLEGQGSFGVSRRVEIVAVIGITHLWYTYARSGERTIVTCTSSPILLKAGVLSIKSVSEETKKTHYFISSKTCFNDVFRDILGRKIPLPGTEK